jgi:uncharacterized repeat protein (TIGR01451 family)
VTNMRSITKAIIAASIVVVLLLLATFPQGLTASSAKTHVKSSEIGRYFLDPCNNTTNFGYCGGTPDFTFVNVLTKNVTPSIVNSSATANFTLDVTVPAGTTGIVQDFLPSGFTFVAKTFKIDGVNVTPTVAGGSVQFNNVQPGSHNITFVARAPAAFFTFFSFDTARAFIIRNGSLVEFSAFQFLVTVNGTIG